jgi:hypothetical protein
MSYEQKYLKYKQKYQELKKILGNNVNSLETERYTEMPDFNLSDTPTGESYKMVGGGNDEYDGNEFDLTETPTATMFGGSLVTPNIYTPSAPLTTCAGQVNPMPNVNVPMAQEGGATLMPADFIPSAPLTSCPGQVNPQPSVPMNTQNKHFALATEDNITEIQNTEDIAKLFEQYGGKHKSSSSSSSSSSSDSDISTSDSF